MLIQETKIFRDSVHGYINVPVDYVTNFIDTELFQRLRHIEQTGMRILYPSARHDRFIHSLGTYFLGHKAFECFKRNIYRSYHGIAGKTDHYIIFKDEKENECFWDKCQLLFEIACLLHDCGHAPFSHTLEFHYDIELNNYLSLKDKLKEYIGSNAFKNDFLDHGSPHERMSALLVCSDFANQIKHLIEKYNLERVDIGNAIEFVARMIIGCKYTKQNRINQIMNCLISLLNSTSIDVDSLDYIIRDAKLSGVDNMNIDVDRLLGSLTLIEITEFQNCILRNAEISANVIEGVLDCNNHNQAEIHGKCRGKMELLSNFHGEIQGTVDIKGSFKIDNQVLIKSTELEEDTVVVVNGVKYVDRIPDFQTSATVNIKGILNDCLKMQGTEVSLGEENNSQVEFFCDKFGLNHTYIDATLDGKFTGKLLGDFTNIHGGVLKCTLGYHKSSLSVIQNVILARNYEYQWIYTHHKVVYYSNYLLVDLFRNCISYLLKNSSNGSSQMLDEADEAIAKALSWKTMINQNENNVGYSIGDCYFSQTTDADIIALFKRCRINCRDDCLLKQQLEEYHTRKYKKSLWKSYAEFNIFFSDFTDYEKTTLFRKIVNNSSYHLRNQYGYFNDEWETKFNEFGLKNVVWVNGDSKLKYLDPDSTYIMFKDCTLTYRTVDFVNNAHSLEKLNLFYLYYNYANDDRLVDKEGLKYFFHSKIKK